MHRDQALPDLCPPSVLRPSELERLQAIFRRALRAALAGALVSTGCAGDHSGVLPTAAPKGNGNPATATGGAGAAGSTPATPPSTPVAGSGMPGSAAAGSGTPASPPAQPREAGMGGAGGDMRPPVAGAAGGGGTAGMPMMPPSTRIDAVCKGTQWQRVAKLSPADKIDYITARVAYPAGGMTQEIASDGTACANSTGAKCQSDLNQALLGDGLDFSMSCGMVGNCRYFYVTTAGDQVKRYGNRQEVLELLGEIDGVQDVMLLLDYDGYTPHCAGSGFVEPSESMWVSNVIETADGYRATVLKLLSSCPFQYARCIVSVSRKGEVKELERVPLKASTACAGRRPEGWTAQGAASCVSALGEHFARMTELEAGSVTAFEVLARELEQHRAPRALIDAARAAACDEVRHTERTSALASALGASAQPVAIAAQPLRSLEEIALDNVVEGCVRETFGAAIGCYQAQTAADPQIAALMREIAADETRHSALAFELDAWLEPQLSAAARLRVRVARDHAIAALRAELCDPDDSLQRLAGLPDAARAAALHASLQRELWDA